ncbi:MAG: putative hemagglutinin/hemolysin-related protein [Labilithrix sp.]|nr:putative hemagglutinin/hemolysin-related protein [Labilithrix sp.]
MWTRGRSLTCLTSLGFSALVAPAGCGARADGQAVSIAPSLAVPRALLDRASSLTLTVLEGSVTCDDAVGQTDLPDGPGAARTIAESQLGTTNCASGVKFCGDLDIAKSETPRVFSAVAKGAGDTTLAIGCATAVVNQDALPIAIRMFRFLAPSVCGDSVIQPTEQCDPGGSAICDDSCTSKELLLSVGSTLTGTTTGGPNDKELPFFLWPEQPGTAGRFLAVYTDHAVSGGRDDVGARAMSGDLSPISAKESPALSAGSVYLTNGAAFPSTPAARTQGAPSAAFLNGKYYVVFEDDDTPGTQGIDVRLRAMDTSFVADNAGAAIGINGGGPGTGGASGAGEQNVQGKPQIATGPKDRLYIAWEDAGAGKIAGRTLSPPATLGTQNDISTGTGNTGVSLAATPTGWVAVWQSGTNVKLRTLNEDGTPQGSEMTVNESGGATERPRVASLPDGRFAVTWSSAGDILVQRYDAKGVKIAGDQTTPINDVVKDGDQTTPSIASTSAAGGSYVAVWLDAASGNVNARMLGGTTGFLFNNVNGQSSEFTASRTARKRKNPVVAAGGTVPAIAIGWEDLTAPGAGIVARRFPLPSE